MMNPSERITAVFNFESVDRLPVIEWASWWRDETIVRWRNEGLPAEVDSDQEIAEFFGLDLHSQYWLRPRSNNCPAPASHGASIIDSEDDYQKLLDDGALYPDKSFDTEHLNHWVSRRNAGEAFIWMSLEGFFWFPRTLFGIEKHMYSFYDSPQLMHRMNADLLDYHFAQLDKFCQIAKPSFITLAEDMSYNHGPMLSPDAFDEFLAPYYSKLIEKTDALGIPVLIDSDGDITEIVNWVEKLGVRGILPLERMAGVDVCQLRRDHEKFAMLGGFDKTVMHLGEDALRREFERILPAMKSGGYIASCDHQCPPAVSVEDYRLYVKLLKEYAAIACQ